MTTDKTGAETTVSEESDRFAISVEGLCRFHGVRRPRRLRVFTYTEVDDEFEDAGWRRSSSRKS